MESIKFAYKYFKRNTITAVIAEILSLVGIGAELLMPLLTGILIDHVIRDGAVTAESGGMFAFLLNGKWLAVIMIPPSHSNSGNSVTMNIAGVDASPQS